VQAADDIGQRRTVDACAIDEAGLTQTFVLRHGDQNGELTRRQVAILHLRVKDVSRTLPRTMQKMNW